MNTAAASPWIVSRSYDSVWFFGAAILGYLFLYLHLGLGVSGVTLFWVFVLAADSPHFFSTYWLTFLDSKYRGKNYTFLIFSLIWIALPIGIVLLDSELHTRILYGYIVFFYLWGWWHIFRQHYGFMVLYQIRGGEKVGRKNLRDYWCVHFLMITPFVYFSLENASIANFFGTAGGNLFAHLSVEWLRYLLLGAIGVVTLFYLGREFSDRAGLNQKRTYFLVVTSFYFIVYLMPGVAENIEFMAIAPIITVFHSVQYHALVWNVGSHRFQGRNLARAFPLYMGAALLFGLVYRGSTEGIIHLSPELAALINAFLFGVATHHYYLDQKIWRVSKNDL